MAKGLARTPPPTQSREGKDANTARATTLATLPAYAAAIDQFESTLGGRAALIDALAGAPLDEDLAFVLRCVADPRQDARKLSTVCATMGVSLFELHEALKRGIYARAVVASMRTIADRMPPVVEDVMLRAAPHTIECTACHGRGVVPALNKKGDPDFTVPEVVCLPCNSTGRHMVYPEVDRQKLALSLTPFAPKSTPMVSVDNRSVTLTDHSAEGFAKLLQATDQILHGRARAALAAPTDALAAPTEELLDGELVGGPADPAELDPVDDPRLGDDAHG